MNQYNNKKLSLGIRQKVLTVLLCVLLTALSISGWFALQQEKENMLMETMQRGTDISRFVAKSLAYSVVGYDYTTIQLLLDEITRSEEINFAKVTSKRNKEMGIAGSLESTNEELTRLFNEDIKLGDDIVGNLTLGVNIQRVTKRLEDNKFSLIAREAMIIIFIAIGEFIALSYIIIKPVRIISESLDHCVDENGNIEVDIPINSGDEFGHLATIFSTLGTNLNDANKKLQTKIDSADERLKQTNSQLLLQQEELKNINEELRHISITDPLTGLYNRRQFEELIRSEMDVSLRYGDINSLLMIDIDFFKKVNDKYGHFTGDIVLKMVADTLRDNLRKTDILCRIGGEEFAVLCKRADKDITRKIAEKLRAAVCAKAVNIGQETINLSISLGASTMSGNTKTRTVDDFYRFSDTALYHSKETGRNRYTHYDDLSPQDLTNLENK